MYPSYIISLMQELAPLWQLHQVSVRWELSMNAQQLSDYDDCRWNTTNANASGTVALNDEKEASGLTITPMTIENLRVIRISSRTSVAEVYRSKTLPVQFLIPNNTQGPVLWGRCQNLRLTAAICGGRYAIGDWKPEGTNDTMIIATGNKLEISSGVGYLLQYPNTPLMPYKVLGKRTCA